jgi:hypothetical protein
MSSSPEFVIKARSPNSGIEHRRRPRTLKAKDLRSITIVVGLGAAMLAAGCGSNEPCNTDPAQVEAARAELSAAQQEAQSAQAALAQAEADKTKYENDLNALPETGELEAEWETLKKGSGR